MLALPLALGGFPLFARAASSKSLFDADNDKILVLVQLQGGNDGLSTIFHADQYANLNAVRSNILVPETSIINFSGKYGFHPAMQGFKDLWENDNLSIIQNVGYPNQNRSHFRSTDIWNTASQADEYLETGWIGRFYDQSYSDYPTGYPNTTNPDPFAITLGKVVSETCQGTNANYSLSLLDPESPGEIIAGAAGSIPADCFGDALTFVNDTVKQTNAYGKVITDAYEKGSNKSTKWDSLETELAAKMKNVARLISGGLQTKIYVVQLGGFDTHDNQTVSGQTTTGIHNDLLKELSDAVCAFQDDLNQLGVNDRVTGMTYSEFGRRIRSNAALGTDHGTAAPLFLFGSCIDPKIMGDHPEIKTDVGIDEGVAMQYDFKDVYSTMLGHWLGLKDTEVEEVIYKDYEYLPIFKADCIQTASLPKSSVDSSTLIYPNPSHNSITAEFHGMAKISRLYVLDSIGSQIEVSHSTSTSGGSKQQIMIDISHLPSGIYFVHASDGATFTTQRFVKI